jgi:hypothetical protein
MHPTLLYTLLSSFKPLRTFHAVKESSEASSTVRRSNSHRIFIHQKFGSMLDWRCRCSAHLAHGYCFQQSEPSRASSH